MSVKLRTKKLSDGSESLYLDTYHKGKRSYEFIGLKIQKNDLNKKQKKELAEKIRSSKELEIKANAYRIPHDYNGNKDFLPFYEDLAKNQAYKSAFKGFKEYVNDIMKLEKVEFNRIDENFCEGYREWLLNNYKNNSAWVYLYKLKAILNKAVKQKIINESPARFVSIKVQETERKFLTEDEIKKLIKTDYDVMDIKEAFLFSCFTGLRISDLKELTWEQIREGKLYFKQIKTKVIEYLPLNESASDILKAISIKKEYHQGDKVFNLLVKSENIGKHLRKWTTKAEIEKYITFHTARHTFATLALTYDVDIYTVSKLLGHRNINTTQVYAKIIDKKIIEAVNKFPSLTS
jgi:integrase